VQRVPDVLLDANAGVPDSLAHARDFFLDESIELLG